MIERLSALGYSPGGLALTTDEDLLALVKMNEQKTPARTDGLRPVTRHDSSDFERRMQDWRLAEFTRQLTGGGDARDDARVDAYRHLDADPELRELARHFDEAEDYLHDYLLAEPWAVGEVAARAAAEANRASRRGR